jgi:hypothetical protein
MSQPTYSLADELRHLIKLLRAVNLQTGTMRKKAKGNLNYRLGLLDEQLLNGAKSLVHAVVSTGKLGKAEDYFDNESALMWEILNEARKLPDPRTALVVLLALNAGEVINHETGQSVRDEPFTEKPESI